MDDKKIEHIKILMEGSCQRLEDNQLDLFELEREIRYFDGLADSTKLFAGREFLIIRDEKTKHFSFAEIGKGGKVIEVVFAAKFKGRK